MEDEYMELAMQLSSPLDEYNVVDFVRVCVKFSSAVCLYCNNARRIAVDARSLIRHIMEAHRFWASFESASRIEFESPEIMGKLESFLQWLPAKTLYMNGINYYKFVKDCDMLDKLMNGKPKEVFSNDDYKYECFECRITKKNYKPYKRHNKKVHSGAAAKCLMCKGIFNNFRQNLCHLCPGEPNKESPLLFEYRCCMCSVDTFTTAFWFMVHIRKVHTSCDMCLDSCPDQMQLSSHVLKHTQSQLCYRCHLAYKKEEYLLEHVFWKHNSDGVSCRHCGKKRWPYIYHFCTSPPQFVCQSCDMSFTKATQLLVHAGEHIGNSTKAYEIVNQQKTSVSRRLPRKHTNKKLMAKPKKTQKPVEENNSIESVQQLNPQNEKYQQVDQFDTIEATETVEILSDVEDESIKELAAVDVHNGNNKKEPEKDPKKEETKKNGDGLPNLVNANLPKSDDSDSDDNENKNEPVKDPKKEETQKNVYGFPNLSPANSSESDDSDSDDNENKNEPVKDPKKEETQKNVYGFPNLSPANSSESDDSDSDDNENKNEPVKDPKKEETQKNVYGFLNLSPANSSESDDSDSDDNENKNEPVKDPKKEETQKNVYGFPNLSPANSSESDDSDSDDNENKNEPEKDPKKKETKNKFYCYSGNYKSNKSNAATTEAIDSENVNKDNSQKARENLSLLSENYVEFDASVAMMTFNNNFKFLHVGYNDHNYCCTKTPPHQPQKSNLKDRGSKLKQEEGFTYDWALDVPPNDSDEDIDIVPSKRPRYSSIDSSESSDSSDSSDSCDSSDGHSSAENTQPSDDIVDENLPKQETKSNKKAANELITSTTLFSDLSISSDDNM